MNPTSSNLTTPTTQHQISQHQTATKMDNFPTYLRRRSRRARRPRCRSGKVHHLLLYLGSLILTPL